MNPYHTLSSGERAYTVKQAAQYLGVHPMTIYKWRLLGKCVKGTQAKHSATILFTQNELDAMAAERRG